MIKLGNEDIHKYLHCKDIENASLERMRSVEPLTLVDLALLLDKFGNFISYKNDLNQFIKKFRILKEYQSTMYQLFFTAMLPDYTGFELMALIISGAAQEGLLYGVGANEEQHKITYEVYKKTKDMHPELYELLYIYYVLYVKHESEILKHLDNRIALEPILTEADNEVFSFMEEKAFWVRLMRELNGKLKASPICYNLVYFINNESMESFDNLKKMSKAKLKRDIKNLHLPDHIEALYRSTSFTNYSNKYKDGIYHELDIPIMEEIKKIKKDNPEIMLLINALDHNFLYFTEAVRNRFINLLEMYTAQERTPPDGMFSLEQVISGEELDGDRFIEIMGDDRKTTKRSPIDIHRELLKSKFKKQGVTILEFMYENDLINKSQQEIAKALHCSDRTIRRYQKLFKENEQFLIELFGSE